MDQIGARRFEKHQSPSNIAPQYLYSSFPAHFQSAGVSPDQVYFLPVLFSQSHSFSDITISSCILCKDMEILCLENM
jgi:hypothetical protein